LKTILGESILSDWNANVSAVAWRKYKMNCPHWSELNKDGYNPAILASLFGTRPSSLRIPSALDLPETMPNPRAGRTGSRPHPHIMKSVDGSRNTLFCGNHEKFFVFGCVGPVDANAGKSPIA